KAIRLNRINIRTLNFDPFIKEEIKDLVTFELEKNGYKAVKEISFQTNALSNRETDPIMDSIMDVTLVHRSYIKDIDEIENIYIRLDLYTASMQKACTVVFNETAEDHLINTKYLKCIIADMIKKVKDAD
ncbi:MAG: hypothetical protein KKH98_14195, partial [Spirochaetes bacterium]|nr:hypothetical protein [Spirochaetota bacterium]